MEASPPASPGGRVLEISAADLVCGDVVLVEGGDIVSADMRLIKASKLQATNPSSPRKRPRNQVRRAAV